MKFLKDKKGQTFLPMRLLMSIVVIAAISAVFYVGIKNMMPAMAENKVERQITELQAMFEEIIKGDARNLNIMENYKTSPGERRVFKLDLPSSLAYLGIGTDPDPDNDGQLERSLIEDGRIIVFKIKGRSKKIYWLEEDIKIRLGKYEDDNWLIKEPEEGLIIANGGEYKITFELVTYHEEKYILIYANNSDYPYYDSEPPVINIISVNSVSPKENEEIKLPYDDILIEWTMYDNIGIEKVRIEYKNTSPDWKVITEKSFKELDKWEYTIEKERFDKNEKYWIKVVAIDEEGNSGEDTVQIEFI